MHEKGQCMGVPHQCMAVLNAPGLPAMLFLGEQACDFRQLTRSSVSSRVFRLRSVACISKSAGVRESCYSFLELLFWH